MGGNENQVMNKLSEKIISNVVARLRLIITFARTFHMLRKLSKVEELMLQLEYLNQIQFSTDILLLFAMYK